MDKHLTSKKLEYLYFLYLKREDFVKQLYLIRLFNVTKVTVSSLISDMESDGYVEKNSRKSVKITDAGIAAISGYIPSIEKMTELFSAEYGIKAPDSIIEAIRFCATMNENTVECVLKAYESRKARAGFFRSANIKPGSYDICFSVLQKDESKLSMGDLGFVKPCRLVCDGNGCRLVLHASEIKYRLLRGKLSRLKYKNKYGEYVIAESDNDFYTVPADAFGITEQDDGATVRISIKALSTCGVIHMPESEAVIRFRLDKDIFTSSDKHVTLSSARL